MEQGRVGSPDTRAGTPRREPWEVFSQEESRKGCERCKVKPKDSENGFRFVFDGVEGFVGRNPGNPGHEIRVNLEGFWGEGLRVAEEEEAQKSRSKELDWADIG